VLEVMILFCDDLIWILYCMTLFLILLFV